MHLLTNITNDIKILMKEVLREILIKKNILEEYRETEIEFEMPKNKEHGDISTNFAMTTSKKINASSTELAREMVLLLKKRIHEKKLPIKSIDVAGPGFINFQFSNEWAQDCIKLIEKGDYGKNNIGENKSVIIEYVSANPTGNIHMGNARGGALGDAISAILEFSGYNVTREFYINDSGNQIINYGLSLEARYFELLGKPTILPENGYMGEDVTERVKEFIAIFGDTYLEKNAGERRRKLIEYGINKNISLIKETLSKCRIEYDSWFKESMLHDFGEVEEILNELKLKNYTYEKDDAIFIKTSLFGSPKDEVLVRSNGIVTYLAPDIAYHKNKFLIREFDRAINILGADHHGYVPRLTAAIKMLGIDEKRLNTIIVQLVKVVSNNEVIKMSKRSGNSITLNDLLEEIDVNSIRFFFILKQANSHLDFDIELAKSTDENNPVYYVQYAYARICGIMRLLSEKGITPLPSSEVKLNLLESKIEISILKKLCLLPFEIERSTENLDVSRLARYLIEITTLFHSFYKECRVDIEDIDLRNARLKLIQSIKTVMETLLHLFKIDAKEKM